MEKLGTNTLDNPHETQKLFSNTKPDRTGSDLQQGEPGSHSNVAPIL